MAARGAGAHEAADLVLPGRLGRRALVAGPCGPGSGRGRSGPARPAGPDPELAGPAAALGPQRRGCLLRRGRSRCRPGLVPAVRAAASRRRPDPSLDRLSRSLLMPGPFTVLIADFLDETAIE